MASDAILDQWGRVTSRREMVSPQPGGSGVTILNGLIDDVDVDPAAAFQDDARWDTLAAMASDSKVEGLDRAQLSPILSAEWSFLPADDSDAAQRDADRCTAQLVNRRGDLSWAQILRMAHRYKAQGCQFIAPEYELQEQEYVLIGAYERHPKTIDTWLSGPRGSHDWGGFKQTVYRDGAYQSGIEIPASRLLAFWNDRRGESWYGRSSWRPLYRPWLLRDKLWRAIAVASRFAAGVVELKQDHPGGGTGSDKTTARQVAMDISVHEKAFIETPYGVNVGLFGGGNTLANFAPILASIAQLGEEMSEAVAAQVLDVGRSGQGSFAAAKELKRYLEAGIEAEARYLRDVLQELADQITALNSPGAVPPTLQFGRIMLDGGAELVEAAHAAVEKGSVTWTPEDEAWERRLIGLPERTVEEIEEARAAKAPAPVELVPEPGPEPIAASEPSKVSECNCTAHQLAEPSDPAPKSTGFRREPKGPEVFVAWAEIDKTTKDAAESLATELNAIRKELIADLEPRITAELAKPDLDAQRLRTIEGVIMAKRKAIVERVVEALEEMRDYGKQTVKDEAERAGSPIKAKLADVPLTAADLSQSLIARGELVADEILRPLVAEVLGGVERAKAAGLEAFGPIMDAVEDLSDAPVKRAVNGRLWSAFQNGRREAAMKSSAEVAVLSSMLDEKTCEECRRLDEENEEVAIGSDKYFALDPPIAPSAYSSGCEGRGNCRCTWINLYRPEGSA